MIPNASITLYNKYIDAATRSEKYQRSVIKNVVQWGAHGVVQSKDGQLLDSIKTFQIRFSQVPNYLDPVAFSALTDITRLNYVTFQEGDYIVVGSVTDEIGSSFSVGALKAKYTDTVIILNVNSENQGSLSMRHWEIGAK